MSTIYDAVDVAAIPANAQIILAYIDGYYQTYSAVRARFPNALILTVTTTGLNAADICDVESGDATPAIAAKGVAAGLYKTVYSSDATYPALVAAIKEPWQWYAANPTGTPHLVAGSVATQWAWPGYGSPGNYDISVTNGVYPNAPAPSPTPSPTPLPTPTPGADDDMQPFVFTVPTIPGPVFVADGKFQTYRWVPNPHSESTIQYFIKSAGGSDAVVSIDDLGIVGIPSDAQTAKMAGQQWPPVSV